MEAINQPKICEKIYLSIDEAAALFGIGQQKIRELTKIKNNCFTLHVGAKTLIRRIQFTDYLVNRTNL